MINLERERLKRQWTLEYVAQMLGVTKSTVCDMEKGRSKPSYEKLTKLESLFNMSHSELFKDVSLFPLLQAAKPDTA